MVTDSAPCAIEPFAERLALYLRWGLALTLLFAASYATTNRLSSERSARFHLYISQELRIPFVPWMIFVYLSVNGLLVLPLFAADCAGINRYGRACAAATGYPVFSGFFTLDRPHNLVPSLHVAYSALATLAVQSAPNRPWLRGLAAVWMGLLVFSVLLVHQHHLTDIAAGLALAAGCHHWLRRRS